jgi:serine phosphatase RsbU (regulator of sigma subunit)
MLHIGEDTEGYLWLGTYFGLHRLDPQTLEIKTFIHDDKNPNSLSSDDVLCFHQDAKGRKWIGTSVGLNLMNSDGTFTRFNTPENLTVHAILPDKKGNLWLSSANTGLYRFDTEKHTFKQFDESDGLQGKEFRHNAAFADKNGTLYFGGLQGLTYFHPDSIQENRILPKVYLTDFKIFNKSVQIGEYDSLLQKSIMQTQEITLSHEHSVFTIDFVALNFTQPEKNQYAYQLEGFDKNWNYIGNQRSTTYTNLDAGTYTFKVKASNNDGIWNEEGTKLIIRILPPWWKTWWFRGGILLSIIFSAVAYYKIQTANLKKRNLVLEQKVAERTKDLRIASEQIQEKNEELQASEEELRQNMEELEANQEFIQEQKKALEEAYHTLSIQNVRITDSIRYAKRIQGAILPHEKVLNDGFSSHFVIYKPKDVVSGDFYWYLETITSNQLSVTNENLKQPTINNQQFIKKKFLAVVDCTGHGVPGAMMSMVGSSFLKEIVQTMQIHEPSQILTELNIKISEFFENKSERFQDGMDMGLCCIEDINENEVVIKFSGAKRSLFYTENDKLHEIRGDRFSIGRPNGLDYLYRLHTLRFAKESTHLYMTTDGWIDAINEQRKRFGSQLFTEMIEESLSLSLNQQKEIFQKALNDYQQNAEQRDDILMVGVRV